MLITMAAWERIRERFSECEKDALNAAVTGELISPRGLSVNLDKLPAPLRAKLCGALPVPLDSHAMPSDSYPD